MGRGGRRGDPARAAGRPPRARPLRPDRRRHRAAGAAGTAAAVEPARRAGGGRRGAAGDRDSGRDRALDRHGDVDAQRSRGGGVEPRDRGCVRRGRVGAAARGRTYPAAGHLPGRARRAVGARPRGRDGRWRPHRHPRRRVARSPAPRRPRPGRAGPAPRSVRRRRTPGRRRRPPPDRRMKRLAVLLGALFGLALLLATPASAHASVVGSDPADGSRLQAAPKQVAISFSESVGLGRVGYLHVTDQTGKRVDARAAFHPGGDGTKVADQLKVGLGDGTYTASFRVVSEDSHPVAGTVRFVVGNGPLVRGSVSGTSTADPGVTQLFALCRWLSYAGIALLAGAWLVFTVWPAGRDDRQARRLIWGGWAAAVVGAVLELLMQGPYSSGGSVGDLFRPALIDDTLHTEYGQLHSLRLVLLGVSALLLARSLQPDARPAPWEASGGLLFIGVAWTFSRGGHAATTSPAWFSVLDDMLHVLAMASWLGGLMMLLRGVLPRREPAELRAVLPVFSRVALIAVAVLAATGSYSALRGVGTVDALFTTGYGLLVVGKVLLLSAIVGAASLARRLVQQRTVAYAMTEAALVDEEEVPEDDLAVERLRRSVFVEALLAFVVLALTALLVAEPRGREALAAARRAPVSATTALGGGRTATVTVDPGTHGPVNVTVALSPAATATASVTVTATQKSAQIGPLSIKLTREGPGLYDGSVTLPVAGKWEVDLAVATSQFQATTADVTVRIH